MVTRLNLLISNKDHFAKDDIFEDGHSGLFGILDGHGGYEVVRFCAKSIPEVEKILIFCNNIDIRKAICRL